MTAQPQWEPTDEATQDLLTLLADDGTLPVDREWDIFVEKLQTVALFNDGLIRPNDLRPLVRGVVKPNRIGAFTARSKSEGLIVATGDWQVSDDTEGRNGGKPARVYRWVGGA